TFLKNGDVLAMPYADNSFDTVLLISILEHLQPAQQDQAFAGIRRVLKPGGQVVYGVPVERPLMVFMFKVLGYDIRKAHFSTEKDVSAAAQRAFGPGKIVQMKSKPPVFGAVYEVGHFVKG
ncbi:MAG: class I SAM-dependent methyltransferase, partial [Chloroflexota bacterium]